MAKKYFLGSVGNVEALRYDAQEAKWKVAFRSKTLTDSGINISTTKDDIRAGTGAPIQFSFYHDPSVEINLTDVVFDQAYVEAQLGAEFHREGNVYEDDLLNFTAEQLSGELSYLPQAINGSCNDKAVIWFSKKGENEWKTIEEDGLNRFSVEGKTITCGAAYVGQYCFRYLRLDPNAQIAQITSNIIPQELFLIITAPVYAGDACAASNGKRAGTITYEIPRFRLNGSQEFAMNMSSNQTMSLSGTAMASEEDCGSDEANLLRIMVQYEGVNWYDDVNDIMVDEDFLRAGDIPHVYAIHSDGKVNLIDNALLTFTPALSLGKWAAAGAEEVKITAKPAVKQDVSVAAAA